MRGIQLTCEKSKKERSIEGSPGESTSTDWNPALKKYDKKIVQEGHACKES